MIIKIHWKHAKHKFSKEQILENENCEALLVNVDFIKYITPFSESSISREMDKFLYGAKSTICIDNDEIHIVESVEEVMQLLNNN